jgi:CheY-like chemotaxis protein
VDSAHTLALLLRMHGHEVRVTHDGPATLEAARAQRPEVVLLDIGLPQGMDGYEVARRLRGEVGLNEALLAAVTGYGREEDQRLALAAGFDRHVVKPATAEALLQLIAEAGHRPPLSPAPENVGPGSHPEWRE